MRSIWGVLVVACLTVAAVPAAETVSTDDIVKMANQGVGEDVLLAAVDRADGTFALNAEQIVSLKQAGVPEKVIAAMLRKKAGAMQPPMEVAARVPDVVQQPAAAVAAQGTLNVENVDDLPWAYRLDPNTKILWISKPDATSDRLLAAHGGVTLSAPAGAYEVRYVGEENSNPMTVVAGQTSMVLVSRVDTQDFEGLYVSVFEQGERKGGGRLAVLRQMPRNTIGQPKATYQYIPAPTNNVDTTPQPQPTERVLVEPSTTVIYRPAPVYVPNYYYGRPYYGPSYYGPSYYGCEPYYPWNRVFMRYGSSGHRSSRSGLSIGFGFGF